jgi:4-hydroxyphenylpyruvate dioxygenase
MRMSIGTVSLGGGLAAKLEAIAAAGFAAVEISESDILAYDGRPSDIAKLAADLGLEIIALQPFNDFEGMPADRRERIFARAERKFDLMQQIGCKLLIVDSNSTPESLPGIDRAAADLAELGSRAGKRGLRIGFKGVASGRHIRSYTDAYVATRLANHSAVGLVLDSFQTFVQKSDLDGIREIPGSRIALVQIADATGFDGAGPARSRHFTSFPGQGDLPLVEFMSAVQATGFDGPLSLEIFNDKLHASSPRSVAVDGHRSLIFLLDRLRSKTGVASKSFPSLPPQSKCSGTEFIEFAIDDADIASFEKLVRGLGFARTGQHKSKSVSRWSQGSINLVMNTDKQGFANSYHITHGTAVCAIGLKVDDAAATLERAEKLRDQPFKQAVGPGELEIPAVRGVGDSLLYFIDAKSKLAKVWEIEFKPTGENAAKADAGLVSVDHISQSMQDEKLPTWLLFYSSLFDLSKLTEQEVLDPGGVVKSQVLQTADETLRLVLNASQARHAQSTRFLWEAFGAGVQHIAFSTSDIFATAKRMAAHGLDFLPVPQNYYDDLETKTELSRDQIAALKANNILYDRDAHGEFFQIYTRTFDRRFFFEIVERRGYKGMGEVNAPIRLASQARLDAAVL